MNEMESFKLPNDYKKGEIISTRDKLGILLKKYPANRFYFGLRSHIQKGYQLSRTQVHAIEDDYRIKIKGIVGNGEELVGADASGKQ